MRIESRTALLVALMASLVAIAIAPQKISAQDAGAEPTRTTSPRPRRELIGAGGRPLPFQTRDEIERFLATADVLSIDEIPVGVTRPQKLELELDGVRAAGAWRTVDIFKRQERLGDGSVINNFRDSFRGEVAAYRLDRLLGLEAVPPTVLRRIRGESGSLQLWIETAMTQRQRVQRQAQPPDRLAYQRQLRTMALFDNLICNVDRNQGNSLIDHNWKVWFIDHTRSFYRDKRLPAPERVVWVERKLWRRLQEASDEDLRLTLRDVLDKHELNALLERRRALVELIRHRIDSLGESEVLYEYGDPEPPMQ